MPIPRKEAHEILKKCELRYGGFMVEPTIDSDYKSIDVFSGELPVSTVKEFEEAKQIGEKYGLKLIIQNFTPGEGHPRSRDNETIYVSACTSLDELREAPEKIAKAIVELKK